MTDAGERDGGRDAAREAGLTNDQLDAAQRAGLDAYYDYWKDKPFGAEEDPAQMTNALLDCINASLHSARSIGPHDNPPSDEQRLATIRRIQRLEQEASRGARGGAPA